MTKVLYTLTDIARETGKHRRTIDRMLRRRDVPAFHTFIQGRWVRRWLRCQFESVVSGVEK